MQGKTYHWTLSCGPSICESSNFFIGSRGMLDRLTRDYGRDCAAACRQERHRCRKDFIRQRMESNDAVRNIMQLPELAH